MIGLQQKNIYIYKNLTINYVAMMSVVMLDICTRWTDFCHHFRHTAQQSKKIPQCKNRGKALQSFFWGGIGLEWCCGHIFGHMFGNIFITVLR